MLRRLVIIGRACQSFSYIKQMNNVLFKVTIPSNAWLFSLKKHPKTHSYWNAGMKYSFNIFCQRDDKLWWASPEIIFYEDIVSGWTKVNCQMAITVAKGKNYFRTWGCKTLWNSYLLQQHELQQQGVQCACYHLIKQKKASQFVVLWHGVYPKEADFFHS